MRLHDNAFWLQTLRGWKPREVLRDRRLNGQNFVTEAGDLACVKRPGLAV